MGLFSFLSVVLLTNQIGSEFVPDTNKFIWLILGVVVVGIGITVFSTVFATWRFLENKNRRFILFLKRNSIMKTKNKNTETSPTENTFYFSKSNFKLMLIGLGLIAFGFILMMGYGANTKPDGSFDPNYWNDDIFSVVRIRIAPLLVIVGFVVQVVAILKRNK